MSRTGTRYRGMTGAAAALALTLSALAACGQQSPETTDTARSMPDAGAGQGSTAGGTGGDGTMSSETTGAPVASGTGAAGTATPDAPGTTTPSATGTDASGAVNPTDRAPATPGAGAR